ncbi:MAG: glycine zipper 2TM domain-containing protein [Sulfuritalea sp.]|nr:glycine zipper 2TM domain-containing protein [Sulfuritalea sp.]
MKVQSTVRVALLAVMLPWLAACNSNPSRQDIGMVGGAVVGGIVGSAITGGSTVGTVGGAAAGGYLGTRIAKEMK